MNGIGTRAGCVCFGGWCWDGFWKRSRLQFVGDYVMELWVG